MRGGGPATRETDLLNPINMVQQIHAVMLSGGSAFGLDAASGAMQYLEEQGLSLIHILCESKIMRRQINSFSIIIMK